MRARRAETAARPRGCRGIERNPGATAARRSWPQSYRGLLRAQPGPERSGGTRPKRQLPFAGRRSSISPHERKRSRGSGGMNALPSRRFLYLLAAASTLFLVSGAAAAAIDVLLLLAFVADALWAPVASLAVER